MKMDEKANVGGSTPTTVCGWSLSVSVRPTTSASPAKRLRQKSCDRSTAGGPPGPREGAGNYYGAFVLDPDGNNIEAVFHGPFRKSAPFVAVEPKP